MILIYQKQQTSIFGPGLLTLYFNSTSLHDVSKSDGNKRIEIISVNVLDFKHFMHYQFTVIILAKHLN